MITPKQFNTIPWKNGLGETTELAINDKGCLDNFDWRLSIASVVNDGVFSNFNGYYRNLVLIEGTGLVLIHDDKHTDRLIDRLDIACFSGSYSTLGKLTQGAIKDFNIITKENKILPTVLCYVEQQQVQIKLNKNKLCFAYSLTNEIVVKSIEALKTIVPTGYLVKCTASTQDINNNHLTITFKGKNMIIIQLEMIA